MYTYSQFLNDLNVRIQNKANSIPVSVRTFINQMIRGEVGRYDYASVIRHTNSYLAVYDDVVRYPLASDMKSEALIDIQMYKNYSEASATKYRKVSPNVFRSMQELDTVAFDYSDGLSWMLGNFNTDFQTTVISSLDSLTSEGTWSAADDGTNIVANAINYIAGSGSISCDMTGGGTTLSIVNSTLTALDLTDVDKFFVWVYLPSYATLTSLTLLYGSSALNYYSTSATTPFDKNSFNTGWNLVAFNKGTATGSPDITAVDYSKISLNFSSAPAVLTGFLFDSLLASTGNPIEQAYYSKYPWKNSSGTWIQDSTSNDDILNATELEYNVWLLRCTYEASKAIPLSDSQITLLKNDYLEVKNEYFNRYPSRRIKEQTYLYRPQNVSKRILRTVKFDDVQNAP